MGDGNWSYLLVVNVHAANLLDAGEGTILVVEIDSRDPVVGKILADSASGAGRALSILKAGGQIESIAAHDGVQMS